VFLCTKYNSVKFSHLSPLRQNYLVLTSINFPKQWYYVFPLCIPFAVCTIAWSLNFYYIFLPDRPVLVQTDCLGIGPTRTTNPDAGEIMLLWKGTLQRQFCRKTCPFYCISVFVPSQSLKETDLTPKTLFIQIVIVTVVYNILEHLFTCIFHIK